MSDKDQLTVAELLARARKDDPDKAEAPKRRRRRSLEDGGVSVAELTGSFKAVKAAPAESRHSAVPLDEDKKPAPSDEDTGVIEKVKDVPEVKPEAKPEAKPEPEPKVEAKPEAKAEAQPATAPDETGVMPRVEGHSAGSALVNAPQPQPAEEPSAPVEPVNSDWRGEAEEDNPSSGILPVIGLAAVGIILGAVVFLAFQFLWNALPALVVALLALVVVAIMVFGVRALRTSSDGLSMTLAGLVGLVVTFGPALLVL
ncbi:hypothetical protein [Corynebacterium tapiri]|uniref:Uncharacterized protein n=1 Tax=Corynebacterium tapiri TaxID=1448266 RepID=A0A5C4U2Z1_9CORY|nr:hypothetical protein [Corynebacterium tapiri]TNL97308.1 hypothetical protein FHE74_06445 [Corynebacterium tapiri]